MQIENPSVPTIFDPSRVKASCLGASLSNHISCPSPSLGHKAMCPSSNEAASIPLEGFTARQSVALARNAKNRCGRYLQIRLPEETSYAQIWSVSPTNSRLA